ncbi:MAG: IS1595 family transposase [Proteobacteria bacterium]|nr:IS1595 family transposase [Pseudomonadota bacterium]MDA1023480.1 IS1595 family transposase [Pseudomonadota bacterium]
MCDLTNEIFTSETAAREYLEANRWENGPFCPHCGETNKVHRLEGDKHRPGLHQCNSCRQQFTVTVGTLFERSKVPLNKWLLATHLLSSSKKGISAHQLHRMIGVTYKTAWFMMHRIREAMKDNRPGPMGGGGKIVEADETYIGSTGWTLTRDGWRKKRGTGDAKAIVSLVERDGRARSFHVDKVNSKTIRNVLVTNVSRESDLMTDEAQFYKRVGTEYKSHASVNHTRKEYVRGEVSTNTVEGFFSIFKRGMKGVYQHCSEQHLNRYLAEFDFRYNTRKTTDAERRDEALRGISGKRLTYRRVGLG